MTPESTCTAELLHRFDTEMRADPPDLPGIRYDRADGNVRACGGAQNWIVAWAIGPAHAFAAVAREAEAFARIAAPLEWKVYGHDGPDNLAAALRHHGVVADELETLMIRDLEAQPEPAAISPPDDLDVQLVAGDAQFGDLVRVTARAFDAYVQWMSAELPRQLFAADPCVFAYVAYKRDEPVASGRLELPRNRSFASLWGGATIQTARRRGIFSALVAVRCNAARQAGYRFVTVDARASSRPILGASRLRRVDDDRGLDAGHISASI